ncbi:MAG TPA: toll/interleukin-1 receptor domain-containing protein [Caulobacteraceae bacterium]|jgi:hypothetical protein|nr:toll/interleukin-1 receptor domain-containing protein [Caulobacteraceae bacterium]
MTTYFLSYARADSSTALRFADDLLASGIQVWVDQYDIRPSQHWDRAVETAVRGCQGLIVVLSPSSAASPNVADEVAVALAESKDIIPILIEKCTVPLRMTRMQFIDATKDYETALAKCLAAIRVHSGGRTRSADPPPGARLPGDTLADAERRLTGLMGPIAGVLVRRAAERAASETELYELLAASIGDPVDRESFLGWLGEPAAPRKVVTPRQTGLVIDPVDAEAISAALVRHLGPIAGPLVRREAAASASREDLCRRLAERIPGEHDRTDFLRDVG